MTPTSTAASSPHNELAARQFSRVLVANRGEIAVRVLRGVRDAGLHGIAVYADQDRDSPHVAMADEAYALGGNTAATTYLDIDSVLAACEETDAEAVHPGYGFLSENAEFAEAVIAAGMVWIGPDPQTIRDLGDKVTARRIAREVGAPLAPGTDAPADSAEEVVAFAREHGLPVAIKAAYGGGGRGLRVARTLEEIPELFESATREAVAAFGRGECFVERYLDKPRHVEAQVMADRHGNVVVIGTRDCSLQRRYQKLVEEAPAPNLDASQYEAIVSSARRICQAADYVSAGTVEYLVGQDGLVSFLEVNTRLQVEHPVTEETTGIDLVAEQLRVARGEPLSVTSAPEQIGHSIEFRINGEDPGAGFLPAPGVITRLVWPHGPGIRVDTGVTEGSVVGGQFDSLLAKLIVTGPDRATALARSRRALDELTIEGIATVLPFDRAVVRDPAFTAEERFAVHTRWIETEFDNQISPWSSASFDDDAVAVHVGERVLQVRLPGLATLGERAEAIRISARQQAGRASGPAGGDGTVVTPMQGTVVRVLVREGDVVETGDLIAVIEAMKMENAVVASTAGRVTQVRVAVGDAPGRGAVLCKVEPVEEMEGA